MLEEHSKLEIWTWHLLYRAPSHWFLPQQSGFRAEQAQAAHRTADTPLASRATEQYLRQCVPPKRVQWTTHLLSICSC